ncbi:portal protein, putative [Oleidesulfovibrio alaskensis G20]|jgi:phage FluMu gp28-like protein|uniref:Portal protein, putative n=1 Tax=Oleidesulfovibrio alaskensis (strain ATCC BAA-1058 / DSM 17464 / G20) TaxID=207559 RepID=Q30VY0_OLEA2|nr:hypothetical protein [Oleidesulfovibrio alaskensis]ABB40166.1 portal protein, putative [Oleidesulfovibrio alaskensis G20]MBL3580866.1 hypothetical protein [Oleidesulfovibrio alaskensis]MBL3587966.1 hypothetical protein [bacterium]
MAKLLPYQKRWINDRAPVKFWEKSRRIGASWGDAADSALVASKVKDDGGMSTYYLSYNKDMTRQYVADVAGWAKKFNLVAGELEEIVLADEDKDVTIYQVRFASGHVVQGLSSNPSNLRSKQGRVRIDEAAFVEDLGELLKAAIALTMWGGDVAVISTHNGEDSEFNQYIQDIRAGKREYSLHRTDLDDALAEGLYKAICSAKGLTWSVEAEIRWRQKLIADYGDGADEELFCVPSRSSGNWLSRNLIEPCMSAEIPVLRWSPPTANFVDWPLDRAYREVQDWCEGELRPLLDKLHREYVGCRHFFGEDFGRSGDLTVDVPLLELENLSLVTPFLLELRNAPYRTQEQMLAYFVDRLPRFSGGALDARGNGQALAEYARQRYGPELIQEVMLSQGWYREHMPPLKARLEDRTILLPKDAGVLDDLRGIKVFKGIARPPEASIKGKDGQRHCDSAVALALALYACNSIEAGEEWACATAGGGMARRMTHGY